MRIFLILLSVVAILLAIVILLVKGNLFSDITPFFPLFGGVTKGNLVYITNHCATDQGCTGGELKEVDLKTKATQTLKSFSRDSSLILVSPNKKFIATQPRTEEGYYYYDLSKNSGDYLGSVGDYPTLRDCAWSDGSDALYCSGISSDGKSVTVSRLGLDKEKKEIFRVTLSKDDTINAELIYALNNKLILLNKKLTGFELISYDLSSGNSTRLFKKDGQLGPVIKTVDSLVFWYSLEDGALTKIDLASGKSAQIGEFKPLFGYLPLKDGAHVYVFISKGDSLKPPYDVILLNTETGRKDVLGEQSFNFWPAAVTKDGRLILIENSESLFDSAKILLYDPKNKSLTTLSESSAGILPSDLGLVD